MAGKVVACHQPNFLPWLGFFAKAARADVFVLLDDVQFTQGAGKHNWTSRVRILGTNAPQWISVPVRRAGEGRQLISEVRIETQDKRWLPKLLRTLEASYGGCKHFAEVYPPLQQLLEANDGRLCELNVALIESLWRMLGLKTHRVRSSSLGATASGSQRLAQIVKAVGGTCYLSGDGAAEYEERSAYESAGLEVRPLGFTHAVYAQRGSPEFVPGLSVLDALSNLGAERTSALLYSGQP